jgi:NADH-quinone oxidoreductase subunit J
MSITAILFWVLSVAALFSALMVVTSRNPIHSVIWLIVTFFAISGHYILLNAQFLAVVNIIVYAGAIMVLFLFVIMLMNLNKESEPARHRWMQLAGGVSGGALLLVLVAALKDTELKSQQSLLLEGDTGLIKNLGQELFSTYVIPFELSSILFLSAMVGAVLIGMMVGSEHHANQLLFILSDCPFLHWGGGCFDQEKCNYRIYVY